MDMQVLPTDLMQWLTETMAGEFTLTMLVSMIYYRLYPAHFPMDAAENAPA